MEGVSLGGLTPISLAIHRDASPDTRRLILDADNPPDIRATCIRFPGIVLARAYIYLRAHMRADRALMHRDL